MRSRSLAIAFTVVLAACGGGGAAPVDTSPATAVNQTVVSTTTTAAPPARAVEQPEYDVFLAAVAETVEGTEFEDVSFDNPELTVATGLLLCERLAEGADVDEIVVDYLAELTDGDVASADDDQLTLTGALVGAATEALCPELKTE